MERALGRSLVGVRVHTDDARLTASGTRAITRGEDIHFAPGAYEPDSPTGRNVIAHELVHVAQQGRGRVPCGASESPTGDALEHQADAVGTDIAAGLGAPAALRGSPIPRSQPGPAPAQAFNPLEWLLRKIRGKGRGNRQPAVQPAVQAPAATEEGDPVRLHAKAYKKARVYHGTHPSNLDSIATKGLLTSMSGTGASRVDTGYSQQSRGKIHVGLSRDVSQSYGTVIRPILPPERTVLTRGAPAELESGRLKGKPHELTADPHHVGGGATTEVDIPSENINFGRNRDISDHLLGVIGQHYRGGTNGNLAAMRRAHTKAIDDGYISE